MSVKTVHVGVGGRGEWPLQLMREDARWAPVALVDTDPAALRAAAVYVPGAPCFSDLGEAMAATAADAVVVITPSALHGRLVRQALASGKHVLVEKPFVHALAEAGELASLALTSGLCLVVAQNYRYAAPQQTMRRLVTERVFGPLGYSTLIQHRYRPNPRSFTMQHALLLEMAVHHFDDMRAVFDRRPLSVFARSFNPPWSAYPHAAAAQALITFEDDLECCYQATFTSHDNSLEWRLEFRDAAVLWDGGDRLQLVARGGARSDLPLDSVTVQPEQAILNDWMAYIEHGIEPSISGRNNLETMAMLDAAIRSSERHRVEVL